MPDIMNYGTISAEDQAESMRKAEAATSGLQAALKRGALANPVDEDLRVFVAPLEPNTKFLVKPGKLDRRTFNNDYGSRDFSRDAGMADGVMDVWAEFHFGVLATRDPEVVAWCEAHSGDDDMHAEYHSGHPIPARQCEVDHGLCRDANWAATPAWADMKSLQHPTSRRNAYIPTSTDVDKIFKNMAAPVEHRGDTGDSYAKAAQAARNADSERK